MSTVGGVYKFMNVNTYVNIYICTKHTCVPVTPYQGVGTYQGVGIWGLIFRSGVRDCGVMGSKTRVDMFFRAIPDSKTHVEKIIDLVASKIVGFRLHHDPENRKIN